MDNMWDVLDQAELLEIQEEAKKSGLKSVESHIKSKLNGWMNVALDIGVTGDAGAGKSTLINSFRDLTDDDLGAAKTGITETTTEPTPYIHPENCMMKIWDLPGVGTPNYPRETYVEKVDLKRFDYFIIVCAKRFTEHDLWLAKEIRKMDKDFLFIRSQAGMDRDNLKKAHPKNYEQKQASLISDIHVNIKKNLGDLYAEENVMVIDSFEKMEFEYGKFQERLVETFPDKKREAVLRTVRAWSSKMVVKQVASLRSTVKFSALASALGGAVPVPFFSAAVDLTIMVQQTKTYYRQLGLDEQSLINLSKSSQVPLDSLVSTLRGVFKHDVLTTQGLKILISTLPAAAAAEVGEEGFKAAFWWVPGITSAVGASMSYAVTYYVLNKIITDLEPAAIAVLERAAKTDSV